MSGAGRHRALGLALLVCAVVAAGCNSEQAHQLQQRYSCERWARRATLQESELREQSSTDSLAWGRVATLYGEVLERLDARRVERAAATPLEHDLAKLACQALLGRAAARDEAGAAEQARADYDYLLEHAMPYRGARAQAALGLAESADRAGRWEQAMGEYERWLRGVRDAEWSMQPQATEIPAYVSRRLRDRGESARRAAWIDLASAALRAAAGRGEAAREARYACFVMLLEAGRWEESYAALRLCREIHDPKRHDGALVLAEASLLAGGMGRQHEALGLLHGLETEASPLDSQYRVAGWLLEAQIETREGNLAAAQGSYEKAAAAARSAVGRSEATLGLARTYAARGSMDEARRYYTQLREIYSGTPAGLLAPIEELRLLRERGADDEARSLASQAAEHYRGVIQQYGTEMPALLAAHYLSECLGFTGRWDRGVAVLDSVADSFGRDPRAGSLLVRAARLAAGKLDDRARAEQLLARLYSRYPDSDLAVAARSFQDSLQLQVR